MIASIIATRFGLGLRQELCHELATFSPRPVNFLEITPENWMRMRGWRAKQLHEHYPLIAHGLNLSIGGTGAARCGVS
ncbi:TPA: DUF692 domain-containing protein [Legionella pneumophila]|nr:DUF692 family protein [Legionella pneumophila]HAU1107062.1 DUF692 domain-containing protein [Legionella pneumophila]